MNDSEKARKLADGVDEIIDRKYKRYARTVAERLEGEFSALSLAAGGEPLTRWKEFKTQLRQNPRRVTEHFAKKCCSELLRELPADERDVLWLSNTVDKGKGDALVLPLYERVQDLAIRQAEREAFYAGTLSKTNLPVSITSDEIVIPLAEYLVTLDDLVLEVNRDLTKRRVYQDLPKTGDHEEMEEAVRLLLENNRDLILPKDVEDALAWPRHERGEILFDRLMCNL